MPDNPSQEQPSQQQPDGQQESPVVTELRQKLREMETQLKSETERADLATVREAARAKGHDLSDTQARFVLFEAQERERQAAKDGS